jgi:rod shape-determining protein MreD
MNEIHERLETRSSRRWKRSYFRVWVLVSVPVAAVLLQVYVPLFFPWYSSLSIPLLVTVYFAVMRRSPMLGVFIGAGIGLTQDSLSNQPLGMFGISKTLVGYAAASVGMRFDVTHPAVRVVLGFVFYLFHEACYWMLNMALLGQASGVNPISLILLALVNGLTAVPLFHILDKLKESE